VEKKAGRLTFSSIGAFIAVLIYEGEGKLLMDMVTDPGLCQALFEKYQSI